MNDDEKDSNGSVPGENADEHTRAVNDSGGAAAIEPSQGNAKAELGNLLDDLDRYGER